jgi:hypothetical protein
LATEDGRPRIKVISTKIPVDQYDSLNLLIKYLFKTGVIETSTPSALLRNSITQLLKSYQDDIGNYRITKEQSTANNNGHQLRNIESNQILGNEHIHSRVNNVYEQHHQVMNMTLVKGSGYPLEKVQDHNKLTMNNKDPESSHIQSTQEKLKEPQDMQFLGNNEQPRAEDPIANHYKLDLAKFMYTLVTLDRQNKSKLVYLEVDEVTKEVLHIIPPYGLENWKKEKADKN